MIFDATILKITCFQAIFEFSNFCSHMPVCSWNAAYTIEHNYNRFPWFEEYILHHKGPHGCDMGDPAL